MCFKLHNLFICEKHIFFKPLFKESAISKINERKKKSAKQTRKTTSKQMSEKIINIPMVYNAFQYGIKFYTVEPLYLCDIYDELFFLWLKTSKKYVQV